MRAARFFFRGEKTWCAILLLFGAEYYSCAILILWRFFFFFSTHAHTKKKNKHIHQFFSLLPRRFFLRVWLRFIFCYFSLFFVFFSRSTFFCAYFHTQYRRMLFSSLLLPSRFFLRKISVRNLQGRACMSVLELVVILCLQGPLCKE